MLYNTKKTVSTIALLLILLVTLLIVTVPCVIAAADSWTTMEPMPTAIGGLKAAVVNGKVYAIVGAVNYEYDPAIDTWAIKKPMPTPRGGFGIAVYENKIYCIGGSGKGVNEVYDPETDTWETKSPMPTDRIQLEANVVNGKIYLIGGRTGGQKSTVNLNQVYDIETDTWTTKEPIPYPVVQYASAVVDDKIYVMGGQNEYHAPGTPINLDLNQIYDTETDTWSLGAHLPTVVWNAAAGATTGIMAPKRIYVIGGLPGGGGMATNITQVYDPENDKWKRGASMPTARAWLAIAVVNDMLYAIGGSSWLFLPEKAVNEQYTPIKFGTIAPNVQVVSPENRTYDSSNIFLVFTVNHPVVWMAHNIDGQGTVTITGNITLSGLSNGLHNITVYAKSEFNGYIGNSEMIIFSIAEEPEPEVELESEIELEPFPTTPVVIASVVIITVVGAGLLIYFKKRKR